MLDYVKTMMMAVVVMVIYGCADDAATTTNESARINFKVQSPDGQVVSNLSNETSLLISLESPDGEPL